MGGGGKGSLVLQGIGNKLIPEGSGLLGDFTQRTEVLMVCTYGGIERSALPPESAAWCPR